MDTNTDGIGSPNVEQELIGVTCLWSQADLHTKAISAEAASEQIRRRHQALADEEAAKEYCDQWQVAIDSVDWSSVELPRQW